MPGSTILPALEQSASAPHRSYHPLALLWLISGFWQTYQTREILRMRSKSTIMDKSFRIGPETENTLVFLAAKVKEDYENQWDTLLTLSGVLSFSNSISLLFVPLLPFKIFTVQRTSWLQLSIKCQNLSDQLLPEICRYNIVGPKFAHRLTDKTALALFTYKTLHKGMWGYINFWWDFETVISYQSSWTHAKCIDEPISRKTQKHIYLFW